MIASMIFFPEKEHYEKPQDYGFVFEDAFISSFDGTKLHGWFLKPSPGAPVSRGVLLFSHGNAGNISGRLLKVKGWLEAGFSVLLYDYRGYGLSEKKMEHGNEITRDSEACLEWLITKQGKKIQDIVLYGESLGSYPSVFLSVKQKPQALILEAPFTSFAELAAIHYPMFPKMMVQTMLKDFEFSNESLIEKIQCPIFIMHGTQDETCPYEMGERLMDKAPEPKTFFTIEGGHHNDLLMAAGSDYWHKPLEFLAQIRRP